MNTIRNVLLCVVAVTAVVLMIWQRSGPPPGLPSARPAGETRPDADQPRSGLKPADDGPSSNPTVASGPQAPMPEMAPAESRPPARREAKPPLAQAAPKSANPASATAPTAAGAQPVQDALAREALSFVGMDAEAEGYWIAAINDPTLSAHERKNLIEDLNEDGLSDKDHPGVNDLPLIINRLMLIEELAPHALDEVNAEAFAEAYKDLAEMYQRVVRQ